MFLKPTCKEAKVLKLKSLKGDQTSPEKLSETLYSLTQDRHVI